MRLAHGRSRLFLMGNCVCLTRLEGLKNGRSGSGFFCSTHTHFFRVFAVLFSTGQKPASLEPVFETLLFAFFVLRVGLEKCAILDRVFSSLETFTLGWPILAIVVPRSRLEKNRAPSSAFPFASHGEPLNTL